MKKSGEKSGGNVNRGRFKPGNDPRRGRGPAKGTGGRPQDEFRGWLQAQFWSAAQDRTLWERGQRSDKVYIKLLDIAFPGLRWTEDQPTIGTFRIVIDGADSH